MPKKKIDPESEYKDKLKNVTLFYNRLFTALEKCSEFGWRFHVESGCVNFTGYDCCEGYVEYTKVEEVPVLGDNWNPWELQILEDAIQEKLKSLEAEAKKKTLIDEAWLKLSPDEREALGMRRE